MASASHCTTALTPINEQELRSAKPLLCASRAARGQRCSRPLSSEVLDVRGYSDVVPHDDFSPAVEFVRGGGVLAFRSGFDQGSHPAAARNKPVSEQSALSIIASKASREITARITDRLCHTQRIQ